MKKTTLLLWSIAIMNIAFAQTYSPDFLDGRVMFKLKKEVTANPSSVHRTDKNSFSIEENLADYPMLKEALQGYGITKFERPSYYTGKTELMKIYRLTFTDFSKIDALVKKLSALNSVEFAEKEPDRKSVV